MALWCQSKRFLEGPEVIADGKSSHDPLSDELKRLKLVHIFILFIMLFSSINQLTTFLSIIGWDYTKTHQSYVTQQIAYINKSIAKVKNAMWSFANHWNFLLFFRISYLSKCWIIDHTIIFLFNVCQVFFVAKQNYVFSSKLEISIIIYIWQYSCLFFYSAKLISEKRKYHIFQTMIQDFKIADFSYHKSMANLLTRAKIKKTSYIVSAWSWLTVIKNKMNNI